MLRRLSTVLAAVVVVVGWSAGSASAHAELISVDPPVGTVVPTTPERVTVAFN